MSISYKNIDATMSLNNSDYYSEESMISSIVGKAINPVKAKRKEVDARIKAFLNDLFLAISNFIELLAPLFDLELIFKILETMYHLIPKLVSISIRDLAFIDQQLSDENQPILLG